MSGYDTVTPEEANDRMDRILSVACPQCGRPAARVCVSPAGNAQAVQHAARWDAWYKAHPDGAR